MRISTLHFDGADTIITCGSDASLDDLGTLTYEAWIYPHSAGENNFAYVVGKRTATGTLNGTIVYINATRDMNFSVDYATTDLLVNTPSASFAFNAWQHIVITWDGSTTATNVHFYVNSSETSYDTQTNGVGARVSDAAYNQIIGNMASLDRTWDGLMALVRIYNRALGTTEITNHYNTERGYFGV